MINLDSIFKSRDITLPTKVRLVKAMVFPVVMYGCESWTVKKAERQRIDAFDLWCWRRLLRVPWTARCAVEPGEPQLLKTVHCRACLHKKRRRVCEKPMSNWRLLPAPHKQRKVHAKKTQHSRNKYIRLTEREKRRS